MRHYYAGIVGLAVAVAVIRFIGFAKGSDHDATLAILACIITAVVASFRSETVAGECPEKTPENACNSPPE